MYNIENKKRVVIKVGTSTLTHKTGRLNIRRMEKLVKVIADIQNSGREVILVSSGAIGLGMAKLGMQKRPTETRLKQACAAVGQCELMYIYDKLFGEYNLTVAQLLLTKYVIEGPRKNNIINTVDELELEFGENDTLAAQVALLCNADLLIILSDIDGFYNANPKLDPDAKLIPLVNEINDDVRKLAGDAVSGLGTGGMITKLNAAEMVMKEGVDMALLNGRNPAILYDLFDGKEAGTVFTNDK